MNRLTSAALLLMAAAAQASAQPTELEINVDMIASDGVCGAVYYLEDNKKLELTINSSNFNVALAVHNLAPEIVNAGLNKENVPVTLIFDGDERTTADVGIYRAGFTYKVMAYWEDNNLGLAALDRLASMDTVSVELDGQAYGPATQKPSGIGYQYIVNCLESNGVNVN